MSQEFKLPIKDKTYRIVVQPIARPAALVILMTLAASYAPVVVGMFIHPFSERVYFCCPSVRNVFFCALVLQCLGCFLFIRVSNKVFRATTLLLLVLLPIPLLVILVPAIVTMVPSY